MTLLQKLEWALDTVRSKLTFGMTEEQAIISRERRVKGVLIEAVDEVTDLMKDIDWATNILKEKILNGDVASVREKAQEIRKRLELE